MGSGKTQAAICMMQNTDRPCIFITIYLDEVDRILTNCSNKDFVSPKNFGKGKLDNLHRLLKEKRNVASTHALFNGYTDETERLIRENDYILIMDEAFSGFSQISLKSVDAEALVDSGTVAVDPDTGLVRWTKDDDTEFFQDFLSYCEKGSLYRYSDTFFMWEFPVGIMRAFKDIYILTYLFNGQYLKRYLDLNDMDYKYIHIERDGLRYQFADGYQKASGTGFKNKIHIFDGKKINSIGDDTYALSSGWFKRNKGGSREKILKDNVTNVFRHYFRAKREDVLWTTFKARESAVYPKGYKGTFLPWNMKATNDYGDRHYLAYLINIFMNPLAKQAMNKITAGESYHDDIDDEYALSEMVQWIWRSAIRNGEDIWIYIPSSRMRRLLINWLNEVN